MEGQSPKNVTTEEVIEDHVMPSPILLPPPPGRLNNHEMYIVQFPKDQIYYVPPSENALIVERYRNSPKNEKKRRSCCCSIRLMLTIGLILLTIIAVVGITLAVLYFIFNPMGPIFYVNDVLVRTSGKSKTPYYEISLGVKNPNKRLGLDYEDADNDVVLLFEGTEVATGKFPTLEQGHGVSSKVKVELTGTNEHLPKVMDKSMNDRKSNTPVSLSLDMKLGVRFSTAGIEGWLMKSDVVCRFKVNALMNNSEILSQACNINFKPLLKI
ncbi:hypothetical protein Lal_00050058 [Lupinus albus]|nr:hypothetical protein Lal_00050058 [Lupinus albus]